jgi:hypothetical protein
MKDVEVNFKAKTFFILQRYWKTENVASVLYEWGEHYSDLLPV